jgi:DNA-binding CsgD family transcriptional regulator
MTDLTAREDEILRLAVEGLSNDAIADRLGISRRTVEAHMRTLFRKTGASRRGELARLNGLARSSDGLPSQQDRLDWYEAAVRSLAGRHLLVFEERVEFTFTVAGEDGWDTIVERRWTTPKPYLVYRMLRPIVPFGAAGRDPTGLEIECDVVGADVTADVRTVVESDGLPLAVVLFQPGLSTETAWTVRYRADGLWEPLRDTGVDRFHWDTTTTSGSHRTTLTGAIVNVVFPPGWTEIGLAETGGAGLVTEPVRRRSGHQVLSWQDDAATAIQYDWQLTGCRPG